MRRLALGLGLLALSACATQKPQDTIYAVFFNDFSTNLDAPAMEIVANAAASAKAYSAYTIEVTGYADVFGTPQAVIDISRARADAVANLLQRDGVEASRIRRNAIGTPPNSQPGVERRRVTIFLDAP